MRGVASRIFGEARRTRLVGGPSSAAHHGGGSSTSAVIRGPALRCAVGGCGAEVSPFCVASKVCLFSMPSGSRSASRHVYETLVLELLALSCPVVLVPGPGGRSRRERSTQPELAQLNGTRGVSAAGRRPGHRRRHARPALPNRTSGRGRVASARTSPYDENGGPPSGRTSPRPPVRAAT
jgi:hypothetical protein